MYILLLGELEKQKTNKKAPSLEEDTKSGEGKQDGNKKSNYTKILAK